jgi:CRP/FNR family transcriptional regulator, cyclic AMP receptor protein
MSETESLALYVKRSTLSQDLNDEECLVLAQAMNLHTLGQGEYLLQQGQFGDTLHLIVAGRAAVTRQTVGGPITLHVMEPGSLAGEMGFVDHLPHTVSVIALEPITTLALTREAFEALLPQHPELVYHVLRAIVRLEHSTLGHMNCQYEEMHNYISKTHGRY